MTSAQRLKVLIASVLERHHSIAAAIDELGRTLEDEIESRVQDRVADLRSQLEGE
jgi:hypothetical protein